MSDAGEGQGSARRSAQAASVTNRWWETAPGAAPPPAMPAAPAALPAPPAPSSLHPLPPPFPVAEPAAIAPSVPARDLELELEASRAEVAALHEMLEDLPEIFERKFRQRVQGLIDEQQRLLADNQMLRDRLYALTPATPTARLTALPGAAAAPRPSLRRTLRQALGGLGGRREPPTAARLSDRDGGRTTAA